MVVNLVTKILGLRKIRIGKHLSKCCLSPSVEQWMICFKDNVLHGFIISRVSVKIFEKNMNYAILIDLMSTPRNISFSADSSHAISRTEIFSKESTLLVVLFMFTYYKNWGEPTLCCTLILKIWPVEHKLMRTFHIGLSRIRSFYFLNKNNRWKAVYVLSFIYVQFLHSTQTRSV
jgi:hypothetical protein